jgi:hypothetical protein
MQRDLVSVATIAWARTEAEEALLRRSLKRLSETGLPTSIADAGTNPGFTEFLHSCPGFVVTSGRERGLVAQVTASLNAASHFDTPFVLYTEPDKEAFFAGPLADFIARADAEADVGVVLAARSAAAFSTFPRMQRYTEGVINHLCGELIGCAGEYSYGPFLVNRLLLPALAQLPADTGWGWRPFLFLAARRRGFRVAHITGEYACPPDQREEDDAERAHRLRQLRENIAGLLA